MYQRKARVRPWVAIWIERRSEGSRLINVALREWSLLSTIGGGGRRGRRARHMGCMRGHQ